MCGGGSGSQSKQNNRSIKKNLKIAFAETQLFNEHLPTDPLKLNYELAFFSYGHQGCIWQKERERGCLHTGFASWGLTGRATPIPGN